MFHNFLAEEEHHDCLRFLWFQNHDLDGDIAEFQISSMCLEFAHQWQTMDRRGSPLRGRRNTVEMQNYLLNTTSTQMMD